MKRGINYVGRYVMTKNRVLGMGYIGLSLVFALLICSCAPVSYDYIGTWNRQPDKLTYINYDQHIKLTFPHDKWEVYTKPPRGALGKIWIRPTKANPIYTVMMAIIKRPSLMTQVIIHLAPRDISLDEYLAIISQKINDVQKETISKVTISSEVVERNNRTIGLLVLAEAEAEGIWKYIFAIFKEEGRFTNLSFDCSECNFRLYKGQFWDIVDSYEYID